MSDALATQARPDYNRRGVGNGFRANAPLPERPTSAEPGSERKILVLCRRAELGQELHHPDDAR